MDARREMGRRWAVEAGVGAVLFTVSTIHCILSHIADGT